MPLLRVSLLRVCFIPKSSGLGFRIQALGLQVGVRGPGSTRKFRVRALLERGLDFRVVGWGSGSGHYSKGEEARTREMFA